MKQYSKIQNYFGQKILCHYIDTDAFVLSLITKDNNRDSKNLEDLFDFSNLIENHDLFSNRNKKSDWKTLNRISKNRLMNFFA